MWREGDRRAEERWREGVRYRELGRGVRWGEEERGEAEGRGVDREERW